MKYLDLGSLSQFLQQMQYKERALRSSDYINKPMLVRDVNQGKLLKDFVDHYGSARLDVVSLSEIRELAQ